MTTIHNPVLRGFNPDPSIVRVGEHYYIATSTFEFHPAVRIHRSSDLAHWEVIGHALDAQIDLRGVPDSGGVWAPSLSHTDGRFWLAYSIVRSMDGDDKDIDNFLVTAESASGPWSEPVYLGSRGFDFSFFHDTDGSHWIVGVQWDQRPDFPSFGSLVLEQYHPEERRMSGDAIVVYQEAGLVEGPNIYHVGDWYYLLIAEGGTGWNHGITIARSQELRGQYERDPIRAILTSRDAPGIPLQKAGHGELVQTPSGQWFLAHLATRPVLHRGERYGVLGRETCLQRVDFTSDGWLRLAGGGHHPQLVVEADTRPAPLARPVDRDDFDAPCLDSRRWSTLRTALSRQIIDLESRPGWLRMRGGHSTASVFDQSMILQRVEESHTTITTVVDAVPRTSREAAGLVLWYDRSGWIWLQITADRENGRHARIVARDDRATVRSSAIEVPDGPVEMSAELDGSTVAFALGVPGEQLTPVPGNWPAWTLSDDRGPRLRFTGLFAGIRADDLDGRGWLSDFDFVEIHAHHARS